MLYVIHAYDYTDEQAHDRRLTARPLHFDRARTLKANGHFVLGGALLSPDGEMIGSLMVLDFDDETQLRTWLETDPYVTGRVWEKIDVKPFRQADV
ncbi:YciI family protein [Salmonirosea aquatica]|uniref:YCII-related domain-containing protein n=1 Tax=Salmonirosea aquatica TaxID=2654236 RepID=A0A7C9F7W7_9BACT|nr:hypothetical protein [Cytophagaceae bacterium SJW1-29]